MGKSTMRCRGSDKGGRPATGFLQAGARPADRSPKVLSPGVTFFSARAGTKAAVGGDGEARGPSTHQCTLVFPHIELADEVIV